MQQREAERIAHEKKQEREHAHKQRKLCSRRDHVGLRKLFFLVRDVDGGRMKFVEAGHIKATVEGKGIGVHGKASNVAGLRSRSSIATLI